MSIIDWVSIISLVVGILSIALSCVALYLSYHWKKQGDKLFEDLQSTSTEINETVE